MRCNRNAVDHIFHMITRLIYAKKGKTIKDTGMDLFTTIGYDTNHYLDVTMSETRLAIREHQPFPKNLDPMFVSSYAYKDEPHFASPRIKSCKIELHLPAMD